MDPQNDIHVKEIEAKPVNVIADPKNKIKNHAITDEEFTLKSESEEVRYYAIIIRILNLYFAQLFKSVLIPTIIYYI